jgi:transposase InsO family protein
VQKLCAIQATTKTSHCNRGETLDTSRTCTFRFMRNELCVNKGWTKILYVDDAYRYYYVYLIKMKDEAFNCFKIYKARVENQLEKRIKYFMSDRGRKHFSNEFDLFCAEHVIIHERMSPYPPQSNGVAKRKNHTLTNLVNVMLDTVGLSKAWWG